MARRKQAICAGAGLNGVFPLDPLPGEPPSPAGLPLATRIALQNEAHIRLCDAVVANLTPFRGPGADAGTVYEVGYARALGKPVFGYSNAHAPYETRVRRWAGFPDGSAADRDPDGLEIEQFGLAENLMVACGITLSGGLVVSEDCAPDAQWTDLRAFRRCIALAAEMLIPGKPCPVDPAPPG